MKTISLEEVSRKIQFHYDQRYGRDRRRLFIHKCKDHHGLFGSVYFSLNGSPPKGFAVYIPGHMLLSFYDIRGRRWQILRNITVIGLDDFDETDSYLPKKKITSIDTNEVRTEGTQ